MVRAVVRSKGQITLPKQVREALHVHEGDDVAFEVNVGEVTMRGLRSVPTDQAWFWAQQWQDGETQASEQLATGAGAVFEDADASPGFVQLGAGRGQPAHGVAPARHASGRHAGPANGR